MKVLIIITLALAAASAFNLRGAEIISPLVANESRIINGNPAREGEFPYQVLLDLYANSINPSLCGGSLLSNTWVLTAAHCTDGIQYADVHLGVINRFSAAVTHRITRNNIIQHPGYSSLNFANDLSLLQIPFVMLNNIIQPVKLPSRSGSYPTYEGNYAVASGFGKTRDGEGFGVSNNLLWGIMQIISNIKCREHFRFLSPSTLCVTTTPNYVSICQGDSGGPLVDRSSGRLVGVSSFVDTLGCAQGFPAGFARVTANLNWIHYNTGL